MQLTFPFTRCFKNVLPLTFLYPNKKVFLSQKCEKHINACIIITFNKTKLGKLEQKVMTSSCTPYLYNDFFYSNTNKNKPFLPT